jgi:hypothetical protein
VLAEGGLPAAEWEEEGSEGLGTASVLADSKVLDPEGGVEEELLAVAGPIRCNLGGCLFVCVHSSKSVHMQTNTHRDCI